MPYIILGLFGLYTLEFGVVGILPVIIDRFHISVSQAGMLMGLFALIVALFGPFLVLVSSRFDRKKVLTIALAGFSLCSVVSAWAPNFPSLMALRVVPALLHPVFFAAAFATAVSLYPAQRAAHATATAVVGTTLGLVLGVPATTWVAARVSYEASFLFCAAVTGTAGVGLLLKLPPQLQGRPVTFSSQLVVLRKPAVWFNLASTVLAFTSMFSVYSYAAEYLKQTTGMTGQTISAMLVVFGIGGVAGNLIAGRVLGRNLAWTVIAHPVILSSAYLILHTSGNVSLPIMTAIALFWGAAHTSGLVITQMWLTSVATEAPGFANSLYVSSANAGVVLGSAVGGAFIALLGISGAIWSGFLFAALALVVVLIELKSKVVYGGLGRRIEGGGGFS
ncbi:MFS transporter [Paraburkholderia bengalensis]|uniref:MFS transporter n=2 Tax=Paraburkholderia bengalensis TaxID=2747562 RepID=A0ABU8J4N2_9BURK